MKYPRRAQLVAILHVVACNTDVTNPSVSDGGSTGAFTTGVDDTSVDDTGEDDGSDTEGSGCVLPEGDYFVAEDQGALVSDTPSGEPMSLGRNPELDPILDEEEFEPADFGLWAPGQLCADLNPGDIQEPATVPPLLLLIYRPQTSAGTSPGTWPAGEFPVALFHHGIGQEAHLYDHLARGLVEDGMIFANIDIAFEGDFVASHAAAAMTCVMRYLTQEWSESQRTGCATATLGHSRSGLAAVLALGALIDDGVDVGAVVSLATAEGPGNISPDYAALPRLGVRRRRGCGGRPGPDLRCHGLGVARTGRPQGHPACL
jgi:hypothetical protein